jgi:hypothetical protein
MYGMVDHLAARGPHPAQDHLQLGPRNYSSMLLVTTGTFVFFTPYDLKRKQRFLSSAALRTTAMYAI